MSSLLRSTGLYALKMIGLSLVAAFPIWYFRAAIYAPFAGFGRLIGQGVPLLISLGVFGGIGCVLLALTKDPIAGELVSTLKRKLGRA
jgi:putative peptidoglycan lipid II flippase